MPMDYRERITIEPDKRGGDPGGLPLSGTGRYSRIAGLIASSTADAVEADQADELERAWAEEIEWHKKALEAGTVEAIPAEEVFRELREHLGR